MRFPISVPFSIVIVGIFSVYRIDTDASEMKSLSMLRDVENEKDPLVSPKVTLVTSRIPVT